MVDCFFIKHSLLCYGIGMAELQAQRNNLLLLNKVLSSRDNISPFTLIIDDLEQTSKPLLRVFKTRAKVCNVESVYQLERVLNDSRQ